MVGSLDRHKSTQNASQDKPDFVSSSNKANITYVIQLGGTGAEAGERNYWQSKEKDTYVVEIQGAGSEFVNGKSMLSRVIFPEFEEVASWYVDALNKPTLREKLETLKDNLGDSVNIFHDLPDSLLELGHEKINEDAVFTGFSRACALIGCICLQLGEVNSRINVKTAQLIFPTPGELKQGAISHLIENIGDLDNVTDSCVVLAMQPRETQHSTFDKKYHEKFLKQATFKPSINREVTYIPAAHHNDRDGIHAAIKITSQNLYNKFGLYMDLDKVIKDCVSKSYNAACIAKLIKQFFRQAVKASPNSRYRLDQQIDWISRKLGSTRVRSLHPTMDNKQFFGHIIEMTKRHAFKFQVELTLDLILATAKKQIHYDHYGEMFANIKSTIGDRPPGLSLTTVSNIIVLRTKDLCMQNSLQRIIDVCKKNHIGFFSHSPLYLIGAFEPDPHEVFNVDIADVPTNLLVLDILNRGIAPIFYEEEEYKNLSNSTKMAIYTLLWVGMSTDLIRRMFNKYQSKDSLETFANIVNELTAGIREIEQHLSLSVG